MTRMTHRKKQTLNCRSRLMQWPWFCGLLGLLFAGATQAADSGFTNNTYWAYTVPPQNLPVIDATNFVNNDWFEIDFTSTKGSVNVETYETEDTINYVNNGTMVTTSSVLTNSYGVILNENLGCGFTFDYHALNSSYHLMAGTFYNPGTIRANSMIDLIDNIDNGGYAVSAEGNCLVNATNIVNPGTVDVGVDSLIQLTGQNVDMTRGVLTIENLTGLGNLNSLDYGVGTDTNQDWDPSVYLQPGYAISSYFNSLLFPKPSIDQMVVSPSTPYYNVNRTGTNYTLTRAVFINPNAGVNVSESVFFGGNPNPYLGGGFVTVQWAGSYYDMATGQQVTNYLYLNDYYFGGANTNNPIVNGVPSNFTFSELNAPAYFGVTAASPNFPAFTPGVVTNNNYSYVDVQLIPTTVQTNNPSPLYITNYLSQVMPGQVQISAASNLDLSLAQISGQNYTSLRAPHQFNGSVGAQIFSPYSDINIGVTNGFLTLTNLIEPFVPVWKGTVQAWSSDWINVVSNTLDGTNFFTVTNEFRVLLINPSLSPTSPSEVQDLDVHSTNLVISDVFNILRSVSIDAQNLTLTTNGPNSVSPDGELNMQLLPTTPTTPVNYAFVWANAFPNLHNLTNFGTVRMPNVNPVNFGSSASPYGALVNHGFFSDFGAIIYATNFESDGWFSNSVSGSFILQSQTATLTNGLLYAGGDVSIASGSLLASNVFLQANRSLTLAVTNLLTDTGVANANNWLVGSNSIGNGFSLPIRPAAGDLLGTTVTLFAPSNKKVVSTWAGGDYGISSAGYTNNVAIGHLVLDAQGATPNTQLYFSGVGASNAIYVDRLELRDYAGYSYHDGSGNLPALAFNTNSPNSNLVIYYADAVDTVYGDVSELINHKNNDHLRWVPTYAGYFSSTNLVYNGATNTFNVALAESKNIDSDGDGTANYYDLTPFFVKSMVNPKITVNGSIISVSWNTVPLATNFVFYSTNLSDHKSFTNIAAQFISPMPYPGPVAMVSTNFQKMTPPRYYWPAVSPWLTYVPGP
jgi:hypothetical protein